MGIVISRSTPPSYSTSDRPGHFLISHLSTRTAAFALEAIWCRTSPLATDQSLQQGPGRRLRGLALDSRISGGSGAPSGDTTLLVLVRTTSAIGSRELVCIPRPSSALAGGQGMLAASP